MESFKYKLPTKIIFGRGEFIKLGTEAKQLGKKAFIVTGKKFAKESGLLDKAHEMLDKSGLIYIDFTKIEPNPESETIDIGAAIACKQKVDFIIGLGGGSVIDAAKAIALVTTTCKPIWDYCERPTKEKIPHKVLPILSVVTVAATGSEADGNSVITNSKTRDKRGIYGEALFPTISIVDPLITLSVPQQQTIDGVVDMFVHILESYLSSKACAPVSDRISEALMKEALMQGEKVFMKLNDIEAREALSWISTLALSGIPNAGRKGPFPMHRMEHPLSGMYGISHGRGLASIMPSYLYHTKEMHYDRLKLLGKNLFSTDSPAKTIERLVHWLKKVDAFVSLKKLGVKREDIDRLIEMAVRDEGEKDSISAREKLNREQLKKIYETAYNYGDLYRKA